MTLKLVKSSGGVEDWFESVLNSLADPVLVVSEEGVINFVNLATEQFFDASQSWLCARLLKDLIPADSPVFNMIDQVCVQGASLSEYGVTLETPRIGARLVTIQVAPMASVSGTVVVSFHDRSIASKMTRQMNSRNGVRSVIGMAALLAHEVKNPLSGIRGAAQLLEPGVSAEDRKLTRLICDETDRICALVDRMDVFSDHPFIARDAVNIHQVLGHVRELAQSGFARHIKFKEHYDPSLPPVAADRDQLIQVFLNLVKNAAEAAPRHGGEVTLSTGYQLGLRLTQPGSTKRTHLPLVVTVEDNGEGIPEDLHQHLFDPFVTTKAGGTGLGLPLVAKLVDDHGGIIEFTSEPNHTAFRVYLPVYQGPIDQEMEKSNG
ncbi:MAG: two-component system nitrogen regulation sensor histidine kinase GlnL [Alphaproteobacteria bacterium]|jgi:two-component system nitrogen regulation sensor histidine kinase GlnL